MTVEVDSIVVWKIAQETGRLLDKYILAVQEGKMVDEASRFSRWLTFSGVLGLADAATGLFPAGSPFHVDGPALRRKAYDVVQFCSPHSQGSRPVPTISQESLLTLHEKIDSVQQQMLAVMSAVAPAVCPDFSSEFSPPAPAFPKKGTRSSGPHAAGLILRSPFPPADRPERAVPTSKLRRR